ncbi:hypothetical protein QBC47DRAFT_325058 [Echria macrotheca]|uniref:Uncharacterized protein n=1 Tax=Echria macrotheca TaxID=438768 RepID=A0AAJ0B949_9PEZI|nr:hypothetical protein QBC47DRAFT_325058 [Echria macrotheca]
MDDINSTYATNMEAQNVGIAPNLRHRDRIAEQVSEPPSPQSYHQTDHTARPVSPLLHPPDQGSAEAEPPTSSDLGSGQGHGGPPPPQKKNESENVARDKPFNSWWWWEITAATLSIVCMVSLLVLLSRIDTQALEAWPLSIQPNSLIAVLTTVAKTSIMVPVATCLGQLKWRHYLRRADRLHILQLFDGASRGPWGSVMILLGLRRRAILTWTLAFVTIVSLGIDPSAQQILEFPTGVSELTNVTAILGYAQNYTSKAYVEGATTNSQVPNPNLLQLQASILNGISGAVFLPTLECPSPAILCEWSDLSSLGICSTFDDVTAITTHNCTGDTLTQLNCTYDFPGREEQLDPIEMAYNIQGQSNAPVSSLFTSTAATSFDNKTGQYLALAAVKVTNNTITSNNNTTPPITEVYHATWFWCARTFASVTATPAGLEHPSDSGKTEKLLFSRVIAPGDGSSPLDSSVRYNEYVAPSTNQTYHVTTKASESIFSYLGAFLSRSVTFSTLPARLSATELDIASFLYTSDLKNVTRNVAATLSNQIRSADPGDNSLSKEAAGTVFFREVYVRVRWGWVVLPVAEVVLVAVLLAAVVIATRGEPLVKTSVIAYLVYEMDERARERLERWSPVTGEEMEAASKMVNVRLSRFGDGRVKLVED